MTMHQTLARPYAQAIFNEALSNSRLHEWNHVLFVLAKIIENKTFAITIGNPGFSADQIFQYLSAIYKKALPDLSKTFELHTDNFIRLLLQYKRLSVLPEIFTMYQALYYRHEKISVVHISSAFNLSVSQKERLAAALKKYFNTSIETHYKIDPSLIGGLMIQSGNLTIDASIKNQLKQLKYELLKDIGDIDS